MDKDTKYYLKIIAKVIILLLIVGGIFLSYKIAIFYLPFIIAMIIATIMDPVIRFFEKKLKMKRKLATIISLILVGIIIVTLLGFLTSKLIFEGTNMLSNLNGYFDNAYNYGMQILEDYKTGKIQIPEETMQIVKNSFEGFIDVVKNCTIGLITGLINTITSIPTMITYIFITIIATIFICIDKQYIPNALKSQIPKKWFEKVAEIIKQFCSVSFKYIKAESKLSFCCFILVLIGLCLFDLIGMDVNYPILMAIFIGFIDLLPLFGAGAVMIPWSIYLLISGNIPLAIAVIVLWIIWAIIKQIVEPKMVSKEMGMHPIFTLIGMYTGFKLTGVLGLILGPIVLLILRNVFSKLIEKGILKSFFEMD